MFSHRYLDVFTRISADVFNPISLGVCHADLCGCSHSDICGWFYSVDGFTLIFVDVWSLIYVDALLWSEWMPSMRSLWIVWTKTRRREVRWMEVSKKLELVWPHVNRAWYSAMLQWRYCHQAGIFMQLLWVIDFCLDISVPPYRPAISIHFF